MEHTELPIEVAASDLGRFTGMQIGADAVEDFCESYKGDRKNMKEDFISLVSDSEADTFRQYSPFEVNAKAFNESADPEAVWAAYEEGVRYGATMAYLAYRLSIA